MRKINVLLFGILILLIIQPLAFALAPPPPPAPPPSMGGSSSSGSADTNIADSSPQDINTCMNEKYDEGETGVDCGGVCEPCSLGRQCEEDKDCTTGFCNKNKVCSTPTCSDGEKNGIEEGIDCGGDCDKCEDVLPGFGGSSSNEDNTRSQGQNQDAKIKENSSSEISIFIIAGINIILLIISLAILSYLIITLKNIKQDFDNIRNEHEHNKIEGLKNYIRMCKGKGYNYYLIKSTLQHYGHSEKDINKAFQEL